METVGNSKTVEQKNFAFSQSVSSALRIAVRGGDELNCVMCGLTGGEIDSTTGLRARLHVGHTIDKQLGGKDRLFNLLAVCSICIDGSKSITSDKPTGLWLLSQVRRAGQEEQLAVLNWLRKKFKV
jgi:5-methylcytosine-specific restriction endonuclease McrA